MSYRSFFLPSIYNTTGAQFESVTNLLFAFLPHYHLIFINYTIFRRMGSYCLLRVLARTRDLSGGMGMKGEGYLIPRLGEEERDSQG